jgi:hypothetical protein
MTTEPTYEEKVSVCFRPLSKKATARFKALVGEAKGGYAKIDNAPGTFMALHIDNLGQGVWALAHNATQNGDVMADPDIEFREVGDKVYPVQYQNDFMGTFHRYEPRFSHKDRGQRELAAFCGRWIDNIFWQQNLSVRKGALALAS